jgi:sigma-B regulation protein RsbQ
MSTQATIIRRNNVEVMGSGDKTLIMGHALGTDQTVWRLVAPILAQHYRIAVFDYVGSGRSDLAAYDPRRYGQLDGYAQDVLDVVDALGVSRPIFVGHSISGSIGVIAERARPEVFGKMIMIGPNPHFIDDPPDYIGGFKESDVREFLELMDQNFIGWASTFASTIVAEPQLAEQIRDYYCATDRRVIRTFAEITFFVDVRPLLPLVGVPTLIVQCSNDAVAPVAVGEYLHRQIPGSSYRLLDCWGHCPHQSQPAITAEVIREFVESRQ